MIESDPFECVVRSEQERYLWEVLGRLRLRTALLVIERFGLDGGGERTLPQLGERFCITTERVRQIVNDASRSLAVLLRGVFNG